MLISGIKQNKISFGWNHSTHKLITERIIKRANFGLPEIKRFDYEILKYSCIEPDFSRHHITKYIHGHFADIDNPSSDPPDALMLAKRYTQKAIEADKNGFYKKRDDYLGYALHFMQDMLNPLHVIFIPVPKGHPERILHKSFETFAAKIHEDVILNTKLILDDKPQKDFFEEILPNAMRNSKNQLIKLKNNNSNWSEIARAALKNTYETTYIYIENIKTKILNNKKFNSLQLNLFNDIEDAV